MRGFGVSLGYDTTEHAHAQKITKRSGETEGSGEGGVGVSPDYNTTQRAHAHNKPSIVEKGRPLDLTAMQHNTPRHEAKTRATSKKPKKALF